MSVTTLTVLGQSDHEFVCCNLSSDIGALSAAYVDMAISQQSIVVPSPAGFGLCRAALVCACGYT